MLNNENRCLPLGWNIMARRELKFLHVDAFTDIAYGGNPAGVVLGANHILDDDLYKIARELNVRETVFVSDSQSADYLFRFMTPTQEIDFSGHATIAAFQALIDEELIELPGEVTMVNLETRAGVLQIEIVKNETTGMHEVQITHKKPEFLETYDSKDIAEALSLSLGDIMSLYPIQTVSTGTPQLMVPVLNMSALERVRPNWDLLKAHSETADYDSIHVFTRDAYDVTSDGHARHFAPELGVNEDPVTGSASGNMGSYMVHYGLIDSVNQVTSIVIEQGHYLGRPGKVFVEVQGDRGEIKQVKVSGTAVTIIKGTLFV
ncbi:MAG: PhzF family phenazine biosynthesis protein [Candidatus Thorarchaeota archaeon]